MDQQAVTDAWTGSAASGQPKIDAMPTQYTGHVVFDSDENHRWHVHIDDLDSANWKTTQLTRPPGTEQPEDGTEILVTVADGQSVGRQSKALYRESAEPWLRGLSAFELLA